MSDRPQARLLHPNSWPIAARLSLDLALAALLPLSVALWFSLSESRRDLELAARDHLEVLAGAAADQLDQLIAESRRVVEVLSADSAVIALAGAHADQSPDEPAAFEFAQRTLHATERANPHISTVFLIDRDLVGLASTNPRNIGMDLSFRTYAQAALAGRSFVSEFVVGKSTGEPGIYCSAPVRGHDLTDPAVFAGAVVKIRGEGVWELLESLPLPANSIAALVDDRGVIIGFPDRSLLYHSLGVLSPEQIAAIDPEISYGVRSINSIGLPALMPAATDDSTSGAVQFEVPPRLAAQRASQRRVAGYAAMTERPWKVFIVQEQAQADAAATALVRNQLAIAGVVSALAVGLALLRARSIVRPIKELAAAADQLGAGDFSARAPKHADDEVGRLADAFNRMAPRLQDAVALKQSLEVAMEVQQSLLPAHNPTIAALDIAGRTRYCDETGGDYYDFIDVSQPHPGAAFVAVGDVMGHGIGAALLMASARAALRAGALDGDDLAPLLDRVNAVLIHEGNVRFMTLAILLIDPERNEVRWASAGHDPTIVYNPLTDDFHELIGAGIPVGIEPGYTYADYRREGLSPGQVLVVGTDGVWEAPSPTGEMFGKDRLRSVIRAMHDQPASEIAKAIETAVDAFRGTAAQKDDITFVVIKVKPV